MAESHQITFKLETNLFRQLSDEAERSGTSPSLAARDYVTRGLRSDQSVVAVLHEQVSQVRNLLEQLVAQFAAQQASPQLTTQTTTDTGIRLLRIDLATAVAAILAELQPQKSSAAITAWVKNNLFSEET